MAISWGGGGGRRGAGFALGPATNTFGTTAGTIAAARTARDTYATANADWLAQYDANGALMIRLLHTGTPGATFEVRAVSVWVDITAAIEGPGGPGGAPGGGAIEEIGGWDTTIVAATDDIFLDLGFTWPDDTEYIAYFIEGDAAGEEPRLLWMLADYIYGDTNGVTASAAGTASAAATRRTIREQITPALYVGRTATNGALIEFSSTITTPNVRFYKYVPSVAQGTWGRAGTMRPWTLVIADIRPHCNLAGTIADATRSPPRLCWAMPLLTTAKRGRRSSRCQQRYLFRTCSDQDHRGHEYRDKPHTGGPDNHWRLQCCPGHLYCTKCDMGRNDSHN